MFKSFSRIKRKPGSIFDGPFIDVKVLYVSQFNILPCVSFIGELDTTRALGYLKTLLKFEVMAVYNHNCFGYSEREMLFNNVILVLNERRIIEVGVNYCQLLHTAGNAKWAGELILKLSEFRIVNETNAIGFARNTSMN